MKLTKKLIYPDNLKRVILALIFVIIVTTITMGAVYDVALKNVTLVQIDEFNGVNAQEKLNTRKSTISEFLTENEISISENDIINKDVNSEISDDDVLIIRKGRKVELKADGKTDLFTVTKPKVGDALTELGIKLSEEDTVSPNADETITDNCVITVDRYTTEYRAETEAVPFKTKRINDSSIEAGKTVTVEEGTEGVKEVKYLVKLKNGEVIKKEYVSHSITKQPSEKIIRVGTKKAKKAQTVKTAAKSAKSNEFTYSKKIEVSATAYDRSLSENGGNSKTAYGLTPQHGVIAVDPKVIPLGTKLYVESSDGGKSWSYGYCIAGDTGGAIKGNKIDLCFNTQGECIQFGRRSATVYILG